MLDKLPEPDLLKTLLEPLLDDFIYWFERSHQLLEREKIPFLTEVEQKDLLEQVKTAQQEVKTTQSLFQVTGGQVGVEMSILISWHRLLTQCWRISFRFRQEQSISG